MNWSLRTFADCAAALEWAAVSAYFIRRYILHRKLVSLGLAVMALGWVAVGLSTLFPIPTPWGTVGALMLGLWVWFTIIRVERTGR